MSAVMMTWFLTGIVTGLDVTETDKERRLDNFTREEAEHEELAPPDHKDGGLPLISDSVFSLIIMVYVLLAFFFVFFLFCWRRGPELSTHKVKLTSLFVLTCHNIYSRAPDLTVCCKERPPRPRQSSPRPHPPRRTPPPSSRICPLGTKIS